MISKEILKELAEDIKAVATSRSNCFDRDELRIIIEEWHELIKDEPTDLEIPCNQKK